LGQLKQKIQKQSQFIEQIEEYTKEINTKIMMKVQDFKFQLSVAAVALKQTADRPQLQPQRNKSDSSQQSDD